MCRTVFLASYSLLFFAIFILSFLVVPFESCVYARMQPFFPTRYHPFGDTLKAPEFLSLFSFLLSFQHAKMRTSSSHHVNMKMRFYFQHSKRTENWPEDAKKKNTTSTKTASEYINVTNSNFRSRSSNRHTEIFFSRTYKVHNHFMLELWDCEKCDKIADIRTCVEKNERKKKYQKEKEYLSGRRRAHTFVWIYCLSNCHVSIVHFRESFFYFDTFSVECFFLLSSVLLNHARWQKRQNEKGKNWKGTGKRPTNGNNSFHSFSIFNHFFLSLFSRSPQNVKMVVWEHTQCRYKNDKIEWRTYCMRSILPMAIKCQLFKCSPSLFGLLLLIFETNGKPRTKTKYNFLFIHNVR